MILKFEYIYLFIALLSLHIVEHECFLFKKKTTVSVALNVTAASTSTKFSSLDILVPIRKNLTNNGQLNSTSVKTDSTKNNIISSKNNSISSNNTIVKTNLNANITVFSVIKILDGDTITARGKIDKKDIKIRFRCVDAPESSQEPWGSVSAKKLETLIPIGSEIKLEKSSIDLYGRTLAEIITLKDININKKMLEYGMVVYYPFQSGCKEFQTLESNVKKTKIGVWSDSKFELPWEYRKRVGIGKIGMTKGPVTKQKN